MVCVNTGTGGSIGRALALAFTREGAMVVGCDLSVDAAQATGELVLGRGRRWWDQRSGEL
jgi:NAD(P)-dependent dehydrogenase (short-subunit alcohol dehydrogenase family)